MTGSAKNITKSELLEKIKILEKKISSLEKINKKYRNNISSSEQLKTEFLAQMSHELRTPVNVILNAVELLNDEYSEEPNESIQDLLTILNSAGRRIHRTIELILDMTELQAGAYKFQPIEFDLYTDMKDTLYTEMKLIAEDKELDFIWHKRTNNSKTNADIYSVMKIFQHLIENAIKFTNIGSVTVTVSRNKKNKLIVEITDTGIGISKDFLPLVFKPFMQEDTGYKRRYEGNGLGLAVAEKFAELNSAKISVKSEKEVGSTFTVEFKK